MFTIDGVGKIWLNDTIDSEDEETSIDQFSSSSNTTVLTSLYLEEMSFL